MHLWTTKIALKVKGHADHVFARSSVIRNSLQEGKFVDLHKAFDWVDGDVISTSVCVITYNTLN